ncbi:MAG: WG repeat-containing protein [Saprospiraceae bacterium]
MKQLLLLALAVLSGLASLKAQRQEVVYPVRVNHKIGHIFIWNTDFAVDTAIPPRFDALSDVYLRYNRFRLKTKKRDSIPYSTYKLFEVDGKLGLLNQYFDEILPNKYKRIRPLTREYFAVEKDSLFTVIDRSGNELLKGNGRYNDIYPLLAKNEEVPEYFLVKTGKKLGIHKKNGPLLVKPEYGVIEPAGHPDYFKVKIDTSQTAAWRLISPEGKTATFAEYQDVIVLDDHLLTFKPVPEKGSEFNNSWLLRPFNRPPSYSDTLKLAEGFMPVLMISEFAAGIRDFTTKYKNVQRLNKHLAELQLMDTASTILLYNIPAMQVVQNSGFVGYQPLDDEYALGLLPLDGKEREFSMLGPDGAALSLPKNYNEILPSGISGVYRVRSDKAWGLLSIKDTAMEVLPCKYSFIDKFDQNIALCRYGIVWTAAFFRDSLSDLLSPIIYSDLEVFGDSILLGRIGDATTDYITYYVDRTNGKFVKKDFYGGTFSDGAKLGEVRFLEAKPQYADLGDSEAWQLDSVVHRYTSLKIKPEVEVQGIRRFRDDAPLTAFIDANRKMGLIDRKGRQKRDARGQALRYTYIGQFINGRARICNGGVLASEVDGSFELNQPGEFRITTEESMELDFAPYGEVLQDTLSIMYQPQTQKNEFQHIIYAIENETFGQPQWGIIDEKGEVIVPPTYDFIEDYSPADSTVRVLRKNNKTDRINSVVDYGCLDYQGKTILPVRYSKLVPLKDYFLVAFDSTPTLHFNNRGHQLIANRSYPREYSEGYYSFREDTTGKWGYLDTMGIKVIPAQFDYPTPFSEGLAAVSSPTSETIFFIDKKGDTLFTTEVPRKSRGFIGKFKSDRCKIGRRIGEKTVLWGFLDRSGKEQIKVEYLQAGHFCKGSAVVQKSDKIYTIIDTTGKALLPPDFALKIDTFDTYGLARFQDKTGKWGLVNTLGDIVLIPKYIQTIQPYVEGYAKVSNNGKYWGLIDTKGTELLPPNYFEIGTVGDGLVAFKTSAWGDWYFWDLRLGKVLPGTFSSTKPFNSGFTLVNGDKIIDRNGTTILQGAGNLLFSDGIFGRIQKDSCVFTDAYGDNLFLRDFRDIEPFQSNVARVKLKEGTQFAAINKRGIVIVPPKYKSLNRTGQNIILNPNFVYGLISKDGKKVLVEPLYDRISLFQNGIFRLEFGEKIGYGRLDETGEFIWLWDFQY